VNTKFLFYDSLKVSISENREEKTQSMYKTNLFQFKLRGKSKAREKNKRGKKNKKKNRTME